MCLVHVERICHLCWWGSHKAAEIAGGAVGGDVRCRGMREAMLSGWAAVPARRERLGLTWSQADPTLTETLRWVKRSFCSLFAEKSTENGVKSIFLKDGRGSRRRISWKNVSVMTSNVGFEGAATTAH